MTAQPRAAGLGARDTWMALSFALGSICFLVGPFPRYADLVGPTVDAVTFFAGSVLFTAGGALQTWAASPARHDRGAGRAAWWAALTQSAGTLFFNVSTFRAMQVVLSDPHYDRLVWRPDLFGSVCFLISGVIAYRVAPRHGWLPARGGAGWWQPAVDLLGCVFFGISAIAAYVLPSTGSMVDETVANVNTCAGAACFLACALAGLRPRAEASGGDSKLHRKA
ncbi:MAG TPA: hypothetical protein VFT95_08205 [Micromonosporaceae bacterium]|nr:hypothetical protein [Micromonosporaceae bacterium]